MEASDMDFLARNVQKTKKTVIPDFCVFRSFLMVLCWCEESKRNEGSIESNDLTMSVHYTKLHDAWS